MYQQHALSAFPPSSKEKYMPYPHLRSDVAEELDDYPADEHTVDGQVNEG